MTKEIVDFKQELSIQELEERQELTVAGDPCKDEECGDFRCGDTG